MSASAPHTVVLGICPDNFRADRTFHFIRAVAELHDNCWIRVVNSASPMYQPQGDFFAPPEHCQELRPNEVAAWEVEDQPDYAIRGLSTRYRTVRRVNTPLEIVTARIASNAPNAWEFLTTVGVDSVVGRDDGLALVEFSDSVVAKMRLETRPSKSGWSLARASDLQHPIDAWPSAKSFQILTFMPNGRQRRFVVTDDLGHAPQSLDLATLDEILQAATRSGGLGAYSGPSYPELKKAREKLLEILKTFPPGKWEARQKRLEQFLADSEHATTAKEHLTAYLASHPDFRKSVDACAAEKTDQLRESLRAEVLASESAVVDRINQKENEFNEVTQLVRQTEEERDRINSEVKGLQTEKTSLEAEVEKLRRERDTPQLPLATVPMVRPSACWLSAESEKTISKPEALVDLIEKNISALGVSGLAARNIGFEVVVAASLGHLTFFRGSLARPIAEAVGMSLAGDSLRIERVTIATSDTLMLDLEASAGSQAVLLLGANLACLDTYGDEIKRTVFLRRHFPNRPRTPVMLATLEDGASALPLHTGFCELGPVLDTDFLPWKPPSKEPTLVRGRLEPAAFQFPEGEFDRDLWDPVIKRTFTSTGLLPGVAASVLKRLTGLSPVAKGSQPGMSFLYGWLLPRLLSASALGEHKEAIQTALSSTPQPHDPRVLTILSAHKVEGVT